MIQNRHLLTIILSHMNKQNMYFNYPPFLMCVSVQSNFLHYLSKLFNFVVYGQIAFLCDIKKQNIYDTVMKCAGNVAG